jgi:GAF domain-containing protein
MGGENRDYFRAFFETSQTILSSESVQDVLKLLVKRCVRAMGAKAGSLRLLDEKTNRLALVASHLLSREYLGKGPLEADKSIPEVMEGKAVVIRDAPNDARIQYQEELSREGINTILAVPVVAKDRVIGVLRLYTGQPRDFVEEEIEFVSALAEMGGLAIANAKIYEDQGVKLSSLLKDSGVELPEEKRRVKQRFRSFGVKPIDPRKSLEYFRVLHEITKTILATLDSKGVMTLIVDRVVAITGVKGCSLFLVNETTTELELVASAGLSEGYLQKGPLHSGKSIRETLDGAPVMILDAQADPRVEYPQRAAEEGITSVLSIPITARERVIGVLRLYSPERREFGREEVVFLSALAEIAGIAIMNARLYERAHYDLSFWQATLEYLGREPKLPS